MKTLPLTLLAVCLCLLAAGCGADDDAEPAAPKTAEQVREDEIERVQKEFFVISRAGHLLRLEKGDGFDRVPLEAIYRACESIGMIYGDHQHFGDDYSDDKAVDVTCRPDPTR